MPPLALRSAPPTSTRAAHLYPPLRASQSGKSGPSYQPRSAALIPAHLHPFWPPPPPTCASQSGKSGLTYQPRSAAAVAEQQAALQEEARRDEERSAFAAAAAAARGAARGAKPGWDAWASGPHGARIKAIKVKGLLGWCWCLWGGVLAACRGRCGGDLV